MQAHLAIFLSGNGCGLGEHHTFSTLRSPGLQMCLHKSAAPTRALKGIAVASSAQALFLIIVSEGLVRDHT